MIPLIVAGAVSLTSSVVDAWKAHSENMAATKAAKTADFLSTLKTATTQAVAPTELQKQQALQGGLQTVTQQILQSPDVQSLAQTGSTASVNLQFNSNGDVFASQPGGSVRQISVAPDVRQQLQQLNGAMHQTPGFPAATQFTAQLGSNHLPVQVSLAAV